MFDVFFWLLVLALLMIIWGVLVIRSIIISNRILKLVTEAQEQLDGNTRSED